MNTFVLKIMSRYYSASFWYSIVQEFHSLITWFTLRPFSHRPEALGRGPLENLVLGLIKRCASGTIYGQVT